MVQELFSSCNFHHRRLTRASVFAPLRKYNLIIFYPFTQPDCIDVDVHFLCGSWFVLLFVLADEKLQF